MSNTAEGQGESTWDRLRRRKLVQWGIAYAAGAWGFLQGLAYMRDTFGWPHQLQQFATLPVHRYHLPENSARDAANCRH